MVSVMPGDKFVEFASVGHSPLAIVSRAGAAFWPRRDSVWLPRRQLETAGGDEWRAEFVRYAELWGEIIIDPRRAQFRTADVRSIGLNAYKSIRQMRPIVIITR